MKAFTYQRADSAAHAASAAVKPGAKIIAGGTNLLDLMKLQVETPSQLVDRTSTTIARRFGLHAKGAITPGKDADVVVFDPAAPRSYGMATSLMNVDYDLYEGETASGSVRHTFSRGTLVYDRGKICTQPGHGRYVARTLSP